MFTLSERLQDETEMLRKSMEGHTNELRVAMPGVVVSYDSSAQTATIQPAIKEKLLINGVVSDEDFPLLVDVPIMFPGGGGYALTFPISAGDEVLVIFADMCIDSFWQSGGTDNNQIDKRRHDLSDGMAIPTRLSQASKLPSVSTSGVELRSEDGSMSMKITGSAITINGGNINITGGNTTIDGKNFLSHTHGGVLPGGSNTGGVS
jgi:hypothetical protein